MRHGQLVLPARFGHRVDDIVGVFLQRIIHARLRGRAAAIVVHPESTANIDVSNIDANAAELRVVPGGLLQTGLDVADVGNLRAKVKVNELEDVEATETL